MKLVSLFIIVASAAFVFFIYFFIHPEVERERVFMRECLKRDRVEQCEAIWYYSERHK